MHDGSWLACRDGPCGAVGHEEELALEKLVYDDM